MKQYQHILMFILPFANEIANALTISENIYGTEFSRLYKLCDGNMEDRVRARFIDSVALFGIAWNISYMGSKHGTMAGLIYGCIILLLSFILPNLFMEEFINLNIFDTYISKLKDKKDLNIHKLILCISFIIFLLLIEILSCSYIKTINWKYNRYSYFI